MSDKIKYTEWTLIPWDGNPALNLQCWRKSFGRGHISVGVGKFKHIVHSFGANSDNSFSSTRARVNASDITEIEAMKDADKQYKKYN